MGRGSRAAFVLIAGLWTAGALAQEMPPAPEPVTESAPAPPVVPETPAAPPPPPPATVAVLLQTSLGDIRLALEKERAPVTTSNFLRYVDQKRFDGMVFYRAMKLDEEGKYGLVQGGLRSDPKKILPPVAHEAPAKTGLSHVNGAISMAHTTPGTARAEFFIMVNDVPSLDGKGTPEDPGYAVFGRVTEGFEVVRAILDQPTDPNQGEGVMKGQMLAKPVKVLTARRVN